MAILLIILYVSILAMDFRTLKRQQRSDQAVYAGILLTTVYMSVLIVFRLKWPFVHDITDYIFNEPARRIVEFLKAPP
jgi:hypothetical protein